jgi:hypothetical protein
MRRSERGERRTVYFEEVGVWLDKNRVNGEPIIHMSFPGLADGHVAIGNDPTKPYGHPKLFKRLVDGLRMVGAPAPDTPEPPTRRQMVAALYGAGVGQDDLSNATDEELRDTYERLHRARRAAA